MNTKKLKIVPSYENYDIHFCTFDLLREIVEKTAGRHFVWPDEGEFRDNKTWAFNKEHASEFKPLWIDPTTAGLLVTIHDLLNPTNQRKFRDFLAKDRGNFGYWVEESWKLVKNRTKRA